MEPSIEAVLLAIFIASVLLYAYLTRGLGSSSVRCIVRHSKVAQVGLREFLNRERGAETPRQEYVFHEQNVMSVARSIIGRADSLYLHIDEVPTLDLVVERKFPEKHLPSEAHPEDLFQASLYALALMDSGVSCSRTRLAVVYCQQNQAEKCMQNTDRSCFSCTKGRRFTAKFSQKETLRRLARLDEIWYEGREPRPAATPSACRRCPYSADGSCNYSST